VGDGKIRQTGKRVIMEITRRVNRRGAGTRPLGALVSCARNPCDIFVERVEDFLGGLGPHEGFGVFVPVLDPLADVFFQCCNAFVDTPAEELAGEVGEPSLVG
jgi:hypothetical protein